MQTEYMPLIVINYNNNRRLNNQLSTTAYLPEEYMYLMADDVIPRVFKKPHCNFGSPLMKTLDWSVETFGLDYNSTGFCIHFYKPE